MLFAQWLPTCSLEEYTVEKFLHPTSPRASYFANSPPPRQGEVEFNVLIFIFLIAKDTEHHFKYLLYLLKK